MSLKKAVSAVNYSFKQFQFDDKHVEIFDQIQDPKEKKNLLHIKGEVDASFLSHLNEFFPLDHTVHEDLIKTGQRNKIEYKEDVLFATFNYLQLHEGSLSQHYVSVVLYANSLLLLEPVASGLFDTLHSILEKNNTFKTKAIDYLFYYLLDLMTDQHLEVYKHLNDQALKYEEDVLESQTLNQEALYLIRKNMLRLKVIVEPVMEDFDKVRVQAPHLIRVEHALYYDDLKDHLLRLLAHINETREMMRHLLDLNLNNQSQKMNRIMTTLTLFSAIFIPLSFLTGFFGMNFVHFELLEYEFALVAFVIGCVLLAVGMVFLFKKMRWFE